ncbi:hypothetical protein BDZ94DRAFT_1170135 [Collybia nuda]|uniref:Beta-glucuronidase C-terminal domain-containing protein n=1 Tax=Collybia nuda TaxID=64659 RepID=A0A9P5Y0R2_9AGAR|nr:hypothetical protein BDZ94DRAFT_1170135 [Collybia nuda]
MHLLHRIPLLALVSSATLQVAYAGPPLNITFPEKPPASSINVVDSNFIGISWELSSFDTLWGKTVATIPHAMKNYLHNIVARLQKPLRIRVGGNGMDGSTYVPGQKTFIEHTDPEAYFNDIPVNFGPVMFDVMNSMYDTVGPMQFTIGLSMRTPHDFSNVVTLAKAAHEKLGDRLDAMLLGNEPDLYAGHGERDAYDIPTYVKEIGDAVDHLRDAKVLDRPIIGGPTICCGWNLSTILDAGLDQYPYKHYTVQRYPQHNCGGPNEKNTNLTYYLSHMNVAPFLNWQQEGMARAQELDIPVLLTEYNSVACGGSNISSTFGAGLWAVDVGLKAAAVNYSAVFLHTREHDITYNLFDPPTPETSTEPGWITGSTYYSALFLAEVAAAEGSIIVDLNLNNSNSNPEALAAAYGIYDNGGTERGKLALLNFADKQPQVYNIPAGISSTVQVRILTAPEVLERKNISWAGQTVGNNGDLQGVQMTEAVKCADGCAIEVPGPGAALVFLGNSRIFTGNSTIAGIGGYLSGAKISSSPLLGLSSALVLLSTWLML